MTAYLIHWNGAGASKCEVLTFPTKLAAETYAYEALPGDRTAIPVEDVLDLHDRATFSGPRLVEIFNAITGNDPGVKKFESLDTARERVFRELTNRFHDVPYAIHPVTQELAMSEAADTTKPKREKKPSTRSPSLTQRKRLNPAAKIHLLVAENPCRPGTGHFDRFALFVEGMTVEAFLAAGGIPGDVRYDVEHGFISLVE